MILPPRDAYSEVVDEKRRFLPDWYTWITELSKEVQTQSDKASSNFLNFFDFLPENLIEGVTDGTNTTDLGQYWQNFRDELAGLPHPSGFIPSGTILTSVSPNWGITNLRLMTGGDVMIDYTGTGNTYGFDVNGTGGVGPIFNDYITSVTVERIRVRATNAAGCFRTRRCISCHFEFTAMGAITHGIRVEDTVTNHYQQPLVKFPLSALHTYGLWFGGIDGAANNTIVSMNVDSNYHGVWMDERALLNNFYGGTSESNFLTNMTFVQGARFNRMWGVDFEGNPSTADVNMLGGGNEFFGCNAAKLIFNGATASSNNYFGGVYTAITNAPGSQLNYINGLILGDPNGYSEQGSFNTTVGILKSGFRQNGTWAQSTVPVHLNPFSYINNTGNTQLVHVESAGVGSPVDAVALLRGGGPQKLLTNGSTTGVAGPFLCFPADILVIFFTGGSPTVTVFPF